MLGHAVWVLLLFWAVQVTVRAHFGKIDGRVGGAGEGAVLGWCLGCCLRCWRLCGCIFARLTAGCSGSAVRGDGAGGFGDGRGLCEIDGRVLGGIQFGGSCAGAKVQKCNCWHVFRYLGSMLINCFSNICPSPVATIWACRVGADFDFHLIFPPARGTGFS